MKDKLDYIRYHIDYLNNKYGFDFMLIGRPYKLVQKMGVGGSRKDLYIKGGLDGIVAYIDGIYKALEYSDPSKLNTQINALLFTINMKEALIRELQEKIDKLNK